VEIVSKVEETQTNEKSPNATRNAKI